MTQPLNDAALATLFGDAHTHNAWRDAPVSDATLQALYDQLKWAPTSMNTQPARYVFLRTPEARERLRAHLAAGNVDKTMAAPVVAIIAADTDFHRHMARTVPHNPKAAAGFEGEAKLAARTQFATLNATLSAGYFILAARAVGLDVGPMSGFNNAGVDGAFFAGTGLRSLLVCNLGYGDPAGVRPRQPRLDFADVCTVL